MSAVIGNLRVDLGLDTAEFARGTARAKRQAKGFETAAVRSFKVVAASLLGVAAAMASVGSAFRAVESYQNMTNAFRGMGQSADQAAASLDAVGSIAQRTRAPLEATADLYRRVSVAAGELGASQQEVLRFTENVGLALAASGTSANEASGALLQLSQAMAGGVVRAEEFNSILEGAYPIAQAAARGIDEAGGSVGRLRQLVVEGKISSEEFFSAIIGQTDQLQAAFANTTPTVSQAMTVLGSGLTLAIGKMNEAAGASSMIAGAIMALGNAAYSASSLITENMDTIAALFDRVGVYAATAAAALAVRYGGAAAIAAARNITLAGTFGVLRAAIVRTGFGALIVGAGELVYQFSRLVSATGGFGEAMSLLGEVAGAVWQGIVDSAQAIPPALDGVWNQMKAGFMSALAAMATEFHDFVWTVGARMGDIPGLESASESLLDLASDVSDVSGDIEKSATAAREAAGGAYQEAAGIISGAFGPAREAVGRLTDTVQDYNTSINEGTSATEAFTNAATGGSGGGGGGSGGGGAAGAANEMSEALKNVEEAGKAAGEALAQAVREAEEMRDEWRQTAADWAQTFTEAAGEGDIRSAFSQLGSSAKDSFFSALGSGQSIGQIFSSGISGVASGISMGGLTGIGAAVSSALPVIGTVLAGVDLIKGFSSSEVIGRGITGSIGGRGEGGWANTYERERRSSFWGLSTSTSTDYDFAAGPTRVLREAGQTVRMEIRDIAEGIGGTARNLGRVSRQFKIDTEGMDAEQVQQALASEVEAYRESVAQAALGTRRFSEQGESAVDTLTRLSGSLAEVNRVALIFGDQTLPNSIRGAARAAEIIKAAGGAQAYSSNAGTFFNQFLSPEQQLSAVNRQFKAQARGLGRSWWKLNSMGELRGNILYEQRRGNMAGAAEAMQLVPLVAEMDRLRESIRSSEEAARELREREDELARERKQAAAEAIARERQGLMMELWRLQDDEDSIRAYERSQLEKSNRGLYDRIQALRDEQEAAEDAAKAQRAAADAQRELQRIVEGYSGFASIYDERRAMVDALAGRPAYASYADPYLGRGEDQTANEIKRLNEKVELLASSMRIVASNTGRGADAAEDQLALQVAS